jgi:[ribosomal protein S5]-alanine N-acetyltransferase
MFNELFAINPAWNRIQPIRIDDQDDCHTLSDNGLVLRVLTCHDVDPYYKIGRHRYIGISLPFEPDTPERFAQFMICACEMVWTIRLASNPASIVGDCVLYKLEGREKEMEFGGALAPHFRSNGVMLDAFPLIAQYAVKHLGAISIWCHTDSSNDDALQFAEKSGFKTVSVLGNTTKWKMRL